MKKLTAIFLILTIMLSVLVSCNNYNKKEEHIEETALETEETVSEENITTKKQEEDLKIPSYSSAPEFEMDAESLEEYKSKMNYDSRFYAAPIDSDADFAEFGFNVKYIAQEIDKDDKGELPDFEGVYMVYHSEKCSESMHYDCTLTIDLQAFFHTVEIDTERHVFLYEEDGIKLYKGIKDEQTSYKGSYYKIVINDRCQIWLVIPTHLEYVVNEEQEKGIISQMFSFAKTMRKAFDDFEAK